MNAHVAVILAIAIMLAPVASANGGHLVPHYCLDAGLHIEEADLRSPAGLNCRPVLADDWQDSWEDLRPVYVAIQDA